MSQVLLGKSSGIWGVDGYRYEEGLYGFEMIAFELLVWRCANFRCLGLVLMCYGKWLGFVFVR